MTILTSVPNHGTIAFRATGPKILRNLRWLIQDNEVITTQPMCSLNSNANQELP